MTPGVQIPLTAAIAAIAGAPAPVALLDTSVLLDVIRAPERSDSRTIPAALRLLNAATARPRGIWTVVTTLVVEEWSENVDTLVAAALNHIRHVDNKRAPLDAALRFFDPAHAVAPSYESRDLPRHLRALSAALLDQSLVVQLDDALELRALGRHRANRPPSARGRNEVDDCSILEHYLELCRVLKGAAYDPSIIFLSSNKTDYCDSGTALHTDLMPEFQQAQLEFGRELTEVWRYIP